MKRSAFNPDFWGCPYCDWPLEPDQYEADERGMYCACGAWVTLPDPPIPPARKVNIKGKGRKEE